MTQTFQIPLAAAETYEAKFVPAIFAEWAPVTLDAAAVKPGQRVLDVACGTGIVARTAAQRVGADNVVGVDLNPSMLTVAARVRPDLRWEQGDVGDLPFPDDAFDAAVCQMALMFFPDRGRALAQMARVTAPGGRVAIVVPASLDQQPGYRRFVDIAVQHAGAEARELLSAYFSCGDADALSRTMSAAGLGGIGADLRVGTARFDSAEDLVVTEVEGSPLVERIDEATYAAIRRDVAAGMSDYDTAGGFEIPLVCQVVVGEVS